MPLTLRNGIPSYPKTLAHRIMLGMSIRRTSLCQRLFPELFTPLHIRIALLLHLALHLLGAEPQVAQLGRAVALELLVALGGELLETAVVRNDLGNASVLDLVE